MRSDLLTIIEKELARFFGDRRMLIAAITPGILIYVMYSFMGDGMADLYAPSEDYIYNVSAVNIPQSMEFLEEMEGISLSVVKESEIDEICESIQDSETDLLVVFPENFDEEMMGYDVLTATESAPNIEMYYNSANTDSGHAYSMMAGVFEQFEQKLANKFDVCSGDKQYDLATEEDVSAMLVSMLMPMLMLMMLFNGCLSVASESIAGEKERGTIATLLVTPMKRRDLALGKMISLSLTGLVSGISSFVGIMLSLPKLMSSSGMEDMKFGYTAVDYGVLLVVIVATTLVIVGAISIISALAKSVKEATSMATPLMLIVSLTGITNMMSTGMQEEWFWYLIPIYNTVQCMNGVFSMDYQMLPIVITAVANFLYAGIFVFVLTKMFDSERIMYT